MLIAASHPHILRANPSDLSKEIIRANKELKGGSPSTGASYAEKCRTAPANSKRSMPPPGPKAEPVKLNGVPRVGGSGIK